MNKVLRRIVGPKSEGITGEWRKSYHHLYSSSNMNIISVFKLRRISWPVLQYVLGHDK
jgi:hypothetical protein